MFTSFRRKIVTRAFIKPTADDDEDEERERENEIRTNNINVKLPIIYND